jgi:ribonuclease HI
VIAHIWCDGSGTIEGMPYGWAALLTWTDSEGERHEREIHGYGDDGTNNIAELTAAIEGLNSLEPCRVVMHPDSEYVMFGFHPCDGKPEGRVVRWKRNGWRTGGKKPVKNRELWERLDAAVARHVEVTWEWVKGHAGGAENNRVDMLAGQARKMAMEQVAT